MVHVFGYFDDDGNRAWLELARSTLKEGGRLALDIHNRDSFLRNWVQTAERWIVRGGSVRKTQYSVRFYAFTELRDLLLGAGFGTMAAVGHDGKPLTPETRRMSVIATR